MSDGRIVIDTKLSNDGIKKDLQTVEKSVENTGKKISESMNKAEKAINNTGKTFKGLDFSKVVSQLGKVSDSIEKTNSKIDIQKQKLDKLKTAFENTTNVKQKDNISAQMEKTESTITKLQTKLDSLNNKKLTLEGYKSGINGLEGEFKSASVSIDKSLDKVEQKAKQTGKVVENSLSTTGESISKVGSKISSVGDTLNRNVTLPIVAAGVAAAKIGMDFDSGMSRVKAISGATGEEFKKLHDQALQLGSDTAFSAKEAAEGMENLASSGFTVNEIMTAMPGMLDLAASSGEGLASSADIAASTLRGFGLAADQAGHVADVLAKNASATNAAVSDTGEAMKYVAPNAHAAGLSLEEVTAAIGLLSNSGIKGSQAGTTLRSMLTRLASPADEAAKAMQAIGFNAFDSQGKLKNLSEIIKEYSKSLEGKTEQQKEDLTATIFGQEAMSGMLTLVQAGSGELDNLTKSYKNADGAAQEMAKTMQDNSKSSIEQMFGSLETAAIKVEEDFAPVIIKLANDIGNLADQFANLSPEQQEFYVKMLLGVAAAAPLLKIVGSLTTGIGGLIKVGGSIGKLFGLGTVAAEATTASAGMSGLLSTLGALTPAIIPVAVGFGGLATVIAGVNTAQDQMKEKLTTTTDGMSEWQKAINGLTGYTFKSKKELEELGITYKEFGDNVGDDFKKKVEDATDSLNKFQLFLGKINLDGLIDEAESSDFDNQIEKMVNDAIDNIKKKQSESQDELKKLFVMDDNTIDENEQKTLDSISKISDKQISEEEQLKADILKIKNTALGEKRALNEQEIKDIQNKVNRIKEIELQALGGTQEEKDYARNEFSARVSTVSTEDAAKLLQEKKKALDEENVQIQASYDTRLDTLKRNLEEEQKIQSDSNSSDIQKEKAKIDEQQIQEEIDKFTKLRDDKVKLKDDEWNEYIKILKEKNPEALKLINQFNGEELTKADKDAQDKLEKMKETYANMNAITKSGTYELENTQNHSMENVTVTVDEATGEIIAAYSETSNKVGGYTEKIANDNAALGQSHAELAAQCQQALNDLGAAHIDATGKIINSSGQAVGSLEELTTAEDGTVQGIYNLNGTPIKIETNADGTIKNMDEVIEKINAIPKNPKVVLTFLSSGLAGIGSQLQNITKNLTVQNNYTGTNNASAGFSFVNEHGWELARENNISMFGDNFALLSGGSGISDHMTSVNDMRQEVSSQVGNAMSKFVNILANSINNQTNVLGRVEENTSQLVDNGKDSLKMNADTAKAIINGINSATSGNFTGLKDQIQQAQYSVDNANIMSIENNEAYANAKAELDRLNDLTSEARKSLGDDEFERQKDYAQKTLDTAKQEAELEIEIAKKTAKEKQEIAENNKQALTKIAEATTTAIKNQLEQEKAAAEKVINDQLDKLERTYDKKIAALEEEETENSRDDTRKDYKNQINILTAKMNNTASQADKDSYALQIKDLKNELKDEEDSWDLEDQKKELQEEYEAQKESYEEKLKNTDEYYDELLETDSLNAQARYMLLNSSSQELVELLNSYAPNWQDAGQTLADSLINGLNSQQQNVQDAVNNLISLRGSAPNQYYDVASGTMKGYATGTNYNPYSGFYKVDENDFELSSSGSVAYVSQGAAIKNHMQSEQFIKAEISKEVAVMKSSILAGQLEMKSLLTGIISRGGNSSTIHNSDNRALNIETFNNYTTQDAEQLAYEFNVLGNKNKRY